jgi:hypothetical protein
MLLVAAGLLALWITSIAHNQPTVGPDEQNLRRQLTVVAGPPGTVTPTPTPRPTVTPTTRAR